MSTFKETGSQTFLNLGSKEHKTEKFNYLAVLFLAFLLKLFIFTCKAKFYRIMEKRQLKIYWWISGICTNPLASGFWCTKAATTQSLFLFFSSSFVLLWLRQLGSEMYSWIISGAKNRFLNSTWHVLRNMLFLNLKSTCICKSLFVSWFPIIWAGDILQNCCWRRWPKRACTIINWLQQSSVSQPWQFKDV